MTTLPPSTTPPHGVRRRWTALAAALALVCVAAESPTEQDNSAVPDATPIAEMFAASQQLQADFSTARNRVASIGDVFPDLEDPLTQIINRTKRDRSQDLRTEYADGAVALAAQLAAGDIQAEQVAQVWFERAPETTVATDAPPLQIEDGVVIAAVPVRDGITCPVAGPVSFVNDWGWPRSGGRVHRGTDMFASTGTPLVATESGEIVRVDRTDQYRPGTQFDLGGRSVTFLADSGTRWYYAHLDEVAAGLTAGSPVRAGQILGTAGRSGNARSTPPHLHIQMHPDNGTAQNPYPTLSVACRAQ